MVCQGRGVGAGRLTQVWGTSTTSLQDRQEAGCVFGEQPRHGTPVDMCHILAAQHLQNILLYCTKFQPSESHLLYGEAWELLSPGVFAVAHQALVRPRAFRPESQM